MGNIVPKPTESESQAANIVATIAYSLGSMLICHNIDLGEYDNGEAPEIYDVQVRLLRIALHKAEEYAARAESDGEESATAAMLAADFAKGDDRD